MNLQTETENNDGFGCPEIALRWNRMPEIALRRKELRENFGENLAKKVYLCEMKKKETTLPLIYRSLSRYDDR